MDYDKRSTADRYTVQFCFVVLKCGNMEFYPKFYPTPGILPKFDFFFAFSESLVIFNVFLAHTKTNFGIQGVLSPSFHPAHI